MLGTRRPGWSGLALLLTLAIGCSSDPRAAGPNGPDDAPPDSNDPLPPDGPDGTSTADKPGVTPDRGATEFVSADPGGANAGARSSGEAAADPSNAGAVEDGGADSDARTVERGDIFRVLDDHRILNLNAYRGLQVIDVSDVGAPRIEGRLGVTGTPIEMYVLGDRAIVLLNDWRGYYGSRDDVRVETREGGLVMSVDIADRERPVLLDQATVPGWIMTSRLTQGGGQAALYAHRRATRSTRTRASSRAGRAACSRAST